jgi:SAM-dependent methyltransferase
MTQPLFISYYTSGSYYEDEAAELSESLRALGLRQEVVGIPDQGTWQRNTQAKAAFIASRQAAHPADRLVYVDADAIVIHRPELFWQIEADFAAHWWCEDCLQSGTLMFSPTPAARKLVARWVDICRRYPEVLPDGRPAWDQRCLQLAVREEQPLGLRAEKLPGGYCWCVGLTQEHRPHLRPTILHKWGGDERKQKGRWTFTMMPLETQRQGALAYIAQQDGLNQETLCGPGSRMAATEEVREWLPRIVESRKLRTILDVGCGDCRWIGRVRWPDGTEYQGFDISERAIQEAGCDYPKLKRVIRVANAFVERIPKVDLILCRDLLVHLTLGRAQELLGRFRGQAKWLAANTFPDIATNKELAESMPGWGWRPLNLALPPFSLVEAESVREVVAGESWHRRMALYAMAT